MALHYLQVDNLSKSYGDNFLFKHISFGLFEGQRIALIARNGAGKSTLLNIIAGNIGYEEGTITFRNGIHVEILEQNPHFENGKTIADICKSSGVDIQMKQILGKLKITDLSLLTDNLSGGQAKRLAIAKVLAKQPDLLILDEPTNHLDLDMVEWLEDYLKRSRMALLLVTHDRCFLDQVCTSILEIDQQTLFSYNGNYSYYLEKKQERADNQNAELARANNLFRKELDWMKRQPQARGSKAQYRIDAFHELEDKIKTRKATGTLQLDVKASYIGSKIFEAKYITKSYGDIKITDHFYYNFGRYEKMGIIGNNGTGKSTFIKMLVGEEKPDSGTIDIGETVRFGYYSQTGMKFNLGMKVIDAIKEHAEEIRLGDGRRLSASQFLQMFLFSPEKQQNYIEKLSGGERRRLYLCTVLMKSPNFLVLDEPTNDLDIVTLNVLEEYLQNFKGCLIVISHDRFFMDKIVDHLLVFHGNADIQDFPGNYSEYRKWREMKEFFAQEEKKKQETVKEPNANSRPTKERERKMSFKEKREFEEVAADIEKLEKEKKEIETVLSSGTLSNDELLAKSSRIGEIISLLDEKEMRWLELSELNQ